MVTQENLEHQMSDCSVQELSAEFSSSGSSNEDAYPTIDEEMVYEPNNPPQTEINFEPKPDQKCDNIRLKQMNS